MPPNEIENFSLRLILLSFVFADVNKLGVGTRKREHFGADKAVVKNDIALSQDASSLQRQQFGIPRTCANQKEFP